MTETRLYWLHALTPLHVGAGRGVGYIDLPIMREKVTNWPLVPGSAVKGVLADRYGAEGIRRKMKDKEQLSDDDSKVLAAFGVAGDEHANSGSLVFTDARIVCLPVRSFYGTFAWCTSPMVLHRLKRDLDAAGPSDALPAVPGVNDGECLLSDAPALATDRKVLFEDLDFTQSEDKSTGEAWAAKLKAWFFPGGDAWQTEFAKRFAIVSDNVFDFLCETGTEVTARVRIDGDRKTVAPGALWYEEALPAETILGGLVWCDRVFGGHGITPGDLLGRFCASSDLQVGGKATVGHGRVRCIFSNEGLRP